MRLPPSIGLLDFYCFREKNGIVNRLPPDWQKALVSVALRMHWGRTDMWNCTLSELRWLLARLSEIEPQG